jgi:hypothetical protein
MTKKQLYYILALVIVVAAIQSCATYYFRSNYKDANSLMHETKNLQTKPFLKAHLKNGGICILNDSWQIDTTLNVVSGNGTQYDYNRRQTFQGLINIPIDSVALFETNVKIRNPEAGRIAALSLLAGLDVAVGIICLTNPKACFGSCPTFYLNENDNFHYSDAEGFSNAIIPSMEYYDIDAIKPPVIKNNSFSITMKNEALETHCVNDVKILAYPIEKGERVFQPPSNDFYLCKNNYTLSNANANEGNITTLLNSPDRKERFSLSDKDNLNSKEEIYLNFEDVKNSKDLGLILHFRQTMMTTYLFYSAMGYMGDNVSEFFARLETDAKMRNKFDATTKDLGGIDTYIWDEKTKTWMNQAQINETGPIAINKQFIPLQNPQTGAKVKIKLVLNKGLWRLDYAALTNVKKQVKPIELSPISIYNKGKLDKRALHEINAPEKYLLSMPGSEYTFNFTLPNASVEYEYFIYSKGYYLEWMREHWIKDKDLIKLNQMVYNPKKFLREEAKNYKQYESKMEQEFWNSKINTKTFSYYEN